MIIKFSHGFEYKGVRYGWYENELYRLPYTSESGKVYADLKKIEPKYIGKQKSTIGYRCQRDWLTQNRIKGLTTKQRNWKINQDTCPVCP
jgi:hypothetical protein